MYYPCSENKGADQLRGYREADGVFVFAYAKSLFSHDAAQIIHHGFLLNEPGWMRMLFAYAKNWNHLIAAQTILKTIKIARNKF